MKRDCLLTVARSLQFSNEYFTRRIKGNLDDASNPLLAYIIINQDSVDSLFFTLIIRNSNEFFSPPGNINDSVGMCLM